MAELRFTAGPLIGRIVRINLGISSLGREQTNTIQLNDYEISRKHAELHFRAGECVLIDLGSSNGTFVNGETVTSRKLRTGDLIKLGQSTAEFHVGTFDDQSLLVGDTVAKGNDESVALEAAISSDDQLQQSRSNVDFLYHAALAAGSYQSSETLLQRMLDLVFCWISAHRVCILIREDEHENLYAKSLDSSQPDGFTSKPFDIEYAVIKHVFRKKEGVVVDDILEDERFPYVIEGESLRNRQIICAPIKSRYGIRGVIYADKSKVPRDEDDSIGPAFDEQQLKLLIAIGLHAAVAIENADHYALMLQTERVTAVGNAMASLSHHIKNILQSINGGEHLIENGIKNQEFTVVESGWRIVQRNQESLANLVMDMLSYSKSVIPRLVPTDLNSELKSAIKNVRARAEASQVNIRYQENSDLPIMYLEPEMMRRVLHNILLAGVQSCRENSGGEIDAAIHHSNENNTTEILLSDNGLNMNAGQLATIFDPLVANPHQSRLGLGLAVAKKLIDEMGGTITAEPNESQGSCFKITFRGSHLQPNVKSQLTAPVK
ncbi:MAG: FHA domain-containing protein [Planctomycetota bacterium]